MPRPDLARIPEYYHRYINQVPEKDLMPALSDQKGNFIKLLKKIPVEKRSYRYAKGKWTIKEVLQHIIDTERVFAYRALCIARKDAAHFPSFDEDAYAANAKTAKRNWDDMVEEFKVVRRSTELLFASFDRQQLDTDGIASGRSMYVLGIGFIIAGHLTHHETILKERYLGK